MTPATRLGKIQGTLYYRYSSGPPALLKVEASMSILLVFSVNVFPKRYEQFFFEIYHFRHMRFKQRF